MAACISSPWFGLAGDVDLVHRHRAQHMFELRHVAEDAALGAVGGVAALQQGGLASVLAGEAQVSDRPAASALAQVARGEAADGPDADDEHVVERRLAVREPAEEPARQRDRTPDQHEKLRDVRRGPAAVDEELDDGEQRHHRGDVHADHRGVVECAAVVGEHAVVAQRGRGDHPGGDPGGGDPESARRSWLSTSPDDTAKVRMKTIAISTKRFTFEVNPGDNFPASAPPDRETTPAIAIAAAGMKARTAPGTPCREICRVASRARSLSVVKLRRSLIF